MKLKVLPYKSYSQSAKDLVRALGFDKALIKKNTTPAKRNNVILNWGNSSPGFSLSPIRKIINKPEAVAKASNKLTALTVMKTANVNVPEFTTDINVAKTWITDTYKVVCRKLLKANSGRGIVLAKTNEELVVAPLYTKFLRKTTEFRVHVFHGEVIDYVQKKRRSGLPEEQASDFHKAIRSYDNGWVMTRDGVVHNSLVVDEAKKAITALGLDFGAVDVVLQTKRDVTKAYVLEVNTAPGIVNTTLTRYCEAIRRHGYVR